MSLSRHFLSAGVAVAMLTGCGESQPRVATPALASRGLAVPLGRSFHGYYLAKFTDVVGATLPFSSKGYVCLRFTSSTSSSGYKWSSVPATTFVGTYLISGNTLFASAIAPWSPDIYASLQGSVNAKQGSGDYIVMQPNGNLYSGGTFTMTRKRKGCS
jgi:hypothetical protein